jgi:hypothetical protein
VDLVAQQGPGVLAVVVGDEDSHGGPSVSIGDSGFFGGGVELSGSGGVYTLNEWGPAGLAAKQDTRRPLRQSHL